MVFLPIKIDYVIFLGSGNQNLHLGGKIIQEFTFEDFGIRKRTRIDGHRDIVQLTELYGKIFLFFFGRVHFYEGNEDKSLKEFERILEKIDCELIVNFCAVGGISERAIIGEIYCLNRVFSFWKGFNILMFPDLGTENAKLVTGWIGPTYGTPAETSFQKTMGFECVGMSLTNPIYTLKKKTLNFGIFTDMGQGQRNSQGENTPVHSHQLVLDRFRKSVGKIPGVLKIISERF